jgi:hypothetical protein
MVLAPLLMSLLAAAPAGEDAATLVEKGRQAFEEGIRLRDNPVEAKKQFRAAALAFREAQVQGARNADLFRAEGNAWFLAGELPGAVLAYQRGLRYRPADRDLQQGLALAREAVSRKAAGGLGRPPVDDRPPWLPRLGFSTWSLTLVFVLYALSCLALARWAMVRRPGVLVVAVVGLLLSLGVTAVLGLATLYEQREHERPLVVIALDDLPLRLGNGESYPSRYPQRLPQGAEARLLFRRGDWLQVELSGGEVGWVPRSAVLVDED